jgi:pre-rRNA-processing protein TSR3
MQNAVSAPKQRLRNVAPMEPPRPAVPPTIVVVHPRENRRKCSVEPLRSRPGFRFWTFPQRGGEPLDGYVRLAIGGPLLGAADARSGLLVLDGTWRLAQRMEPFFRDVPVRSLRRGDRLPCASKAHPAGAGLATIEASTPHSSRRAAGRRAARPSPLGGAFLEAPRAARGRRVTRHGRRAHQMRARRLVAPHRVAFTPNAS